MAKKDNERSNFEQEEETALEPLFSDEEEENRYGRFKNADALYNSYLKLEAEFTRRSQQLKRLRNICAEHGLDEEGQPVGKDEGAKGKIASDKADCGFVVEKDNSADSDEIKEEISEGKDGGKNKTEQVSVPDDVREEIIKEYLDGVAKRKIPLIKGGGIVPAGRQRISSISRAGNLSLQYFRGEGK